MSHACHRFWNATKPSPFCSLLTRCTIPCACHAKRHLNLQKCSVPLRFLHSWLRNVLRAATACTFATSQLPKVVWTQKFLTLLTSKCASRHNGVHFFDISTSKSGPTLRCFVHFYFEMCFAPQRRALFRHWNFQKWSEHGVFCTFWRRNVLRATTACNFSSSHLASWLRTPRFSEPTFRPSGATNHWRNTVFRNFPTFSRICLFFLLLFLFSDLLSSTLLFSLTLPISAFHLSILSEVWLLNFLRIYTTPITQQEEEEEQQLLLLPPPSPQLELQLQLHFSTLHYTNYTTNTNTSSTAQGGGGSFKIGNL